MAAELQTVSGAPIHDGTTQTVDEAIYNCAVLCLLEKRGRPVEASMNVRDMMNLAQCVGYRPSGRVLFHDGAIDLWLPSGTLHVVADTTAREGVVGLFDSEGRGIAAVKLNSWRSKP